MCIEEPTATVSLLQSLWLVMCWIMSNFFIAHSNYCFAQVRNVRQQEKLKYPPYPLNTLELAKRASWYFRMSAEHTMKVSYCWEHNEGFFIPILFYFAQFHKFGVLYAYCLHLVQLHIGGRRTLPIRFHQLSPYRN